MLIAGAADSEPAKLACAIVNTLTTILLIVLNVLALWGERNLPILEAVPLTWGLVQYYSVIILLPLVAGGYLTALLKAVQEYWGARTRKESET